MKKIKSKIVRIFFSVFFLIFSTSQNSFASPSRNLTVFAEQNMVAALTKIARLYSQKSNVIVSINFNSSSDLVAEIDSGEPADVFISGHRGWIESLHQKGLVDVYNVGYIANDELVLTASKSNKKILPGLLEKNLSLEDAAKILDLHGETLILDHEGSSVGSLGNSFIQKFSFQNLKLFKKLNEDKTPFLNIVKSNPEQYSIMFSSQAKNDKDLKILVTSQNEHIFYQALVIAGDNMDVAREFLKFLSSKTAKSVFVESGFASN